MALRFFRKQDLLNEAYSLGSSAVGFFHGIVQDLENAAGIFKHVADTEQQNIADAQARLDEATEAAAGHQSLAEKVKGLLS